MSRDRTRYVVVFDGYVYGKDDRHARIKANDMIQKIKHAHPGSDVSITKIYEQPFGRLGNRELQDTSDPREKMPF